MIENNLITNSVNEHSLLSIIFAHFYISIHTFLSLFLSCNFSFDTMNWKEFLNFLFLEFIRMNVEILFLSQSVQCGQMRNIKSISITYIFHCKHNTISTYYASCHTFKLVIEETLIYNNDDQLKMNTE